MASQFQLVMQNGPSPGKTFELPLGEFTIGRDIGNNIVINDAEVSRRHARMAAQVGGYVIEDLGSTNGTFVDGQRLMGPHLLRPGETIMFGEKVSLIYEALGFDVNATLVGSPTGMPAPAASPDTFRVPPADQGYAPPPPPLQQNAYPAPIPQTELVPSVPNYQPAYSGQVPPGPAEPYMPAAESPAGMYAEPYEIPYEEEGEQKRSNTLIYLGCGCLVILLCMCMVGAYAFDAADLYCEAPFDSIFDALGFTCP